MFVFALCWSCFIRLHALALGVVRGVGTQLLACVWLGFPGLRIRCPLTGRVGWLVTGRHHHCRSSDGGRFPPPSLLSLAFPTKDGWGYLVVWFPALCSAGIVVIGVCGVLVLIMACPTPEWAAAAAYLDADHEVGVVIPMSSLPTLALGVVHCRAVSLAIVSVVGGGRD